MKCLSIYAMLLGGIAWTQITLSADAQPQQNELLSSKVVASMPASVDEMNEKELRAYVVHLEKILAQATANFKLIYENQQKKIKQQEEEIKQLKKENAWLANKQGE